jgi:hypothetical protein
MVKLPLAVALAASLTVTVKLELPAAVGVPVIAPLAFIDNPFGRLPDVTDQLYGGVPPVAFTDPEYPAPTVPFGRLAVATASAGAVIVIVKLPDAVALAESVTVTVKVELPAAVGVPEIAPSAVIDNPFGRLPDMIDQLYGGVPPVADNEPE